MRGVRIVLLPSWYPTAEQPHAGSFIRSLAHALAGAGHDATVLFPELRSLRFWRPGDGSGELVERADGPVREMRWIGFRWWPRERHGTVAFTSAARRLFYEYVTRYGSPDVLHAHVVLPAGHAAMRLAGNWDVPFVLTEHTGPFAIMMETAWQRRQVRGAMAAADAVTVVSAAAMEEIGAAGIQREMEVVPNALDASFVEIPDARIAAGRRVGEAIRFVTVAALTAAKGVADLLEAFALVRRQRPTSALRIIGDGPLRRELEQRAAEQNASACVEFIGSLAGPQRVRDALLDGDVFVLPSYGETFGVAVIEALACGLPVIATRCGGPESIVTGTCGTLVPIGDIAAMGAAMLDWARRIESVDRRAIRAACLARFAPGVIAAKYAAVYERVIRRFAELHPTAERIPPAGRAD